MCIVYSSPKTIAVWGKKCSQRFSISTTLSYIIMLDTIYNNAMGEYLCLDNGKCLMLP